MRYCMCLSKSSTLQLLMRIHTIQSANTEPTAAMNSRLVIRWEGGTPLRLAISLSSNQGISRCRTSGTMKPKSRMT